MKKYVLTLVFISLCLLSYNFAYGENFKKTRIAVLDFQIQGTGFETEDMGKIVAEWLITALVQEGRFDVIERRLLEKVLKEQNLGASGVVDTQSASKLGKVLGARVVISGTVISFHD
jgi:curli biogenesis system outer membrane secretion channel CsgG